ncbi:MAG: HK97 gp10 family phage protein [Pelagibacterium sp.]|uniref:HK97-gp10 family putative phage morphogenesis protein n=1 Tax=Pelagibacterium sp. TaxID=1967288 RepID=UPI0032EEB41D
MSRTTGADDIARALAELGTAIGTPVNAASRKALRPMLKAAKKNAPKDDGDLQKSLTIKRNTKAPRGVSVHVVGPASNYVGADGAKPVRYAHITEFGTADGTVAGTRWLTRAFDETSKETLDTLGREIGPEIEKAAAKRARRRAKK